MANLGLVVAVAALVGHLTVPRGLLRQEVPLTVAATVLFAVLVQGGLTRPEGALLVLGLALALVILVRPSDSRAEHVDGDETELAGEVGTFLADEGAPSGRRMAYNIVAGLAGTLAGAHLLVTGAVDVATELDLSGGFVGMTVVALGTSLPELVTAIAASRAGEDQLIFGNVLGSNLFNCLAVGGLVGLAGPGPLTDAGLTVDGVMLMLAITVLGVAAMVRGRLVTRGEAAALLIAYGAFLPFLSD